MDSLETFRVMERSGMMKHKTSNLVTASKESKVNYTAKRNSNKCSSILRIREKSREALLQKKKKKKT